MSTLQRLKEMKNITPHQGEGFKSCDNDPLRDSCSSDGQARSLRIARYDLTTGEKAGMLIWDIATSFSHSGVTESSGSTKHAPKSDLRPSYRKPVVLPEFPE
jgi:hypothetical protein